MKGDDRMLLSNKRGKELLTKLEGGNVQPNEIMMLINAGANVNIADESGTTALSYAAKHGMADIAKMLIYAGANVNFLDKYGGTPILDAVFSNRPDIVKILIEAGAHVNTGSMPILYATEHGMAEVAILLIKAGAYVNMGRKDGTTALMYACAHGMADVVKMLIEAGAYANIANKDGVSALFNAAEHGRADVAKLLIEAGAYVNYIYKDGETALTCTLRKGHREVAIILIKAGAYVNIANKDGNTALYYAVEHGMTDVIKLLIEDGADVKMVNKGGNTALGYAAKQGKADAVKLLIGAGAYVNYVYNDGETALCYAAENGKTDVVKLLIEAGADMNIADKEGNTALYYAFKNNMIDAAKILIEAGADVRITDKQRYYTLWLAQKSGPEMKTYTSSQWGLSFRYPAAWEVIYENDMSGSWSIAIAVGGKMRGGQRPVFMVNARGDEILSPPWVTDLMRADGSVVTAMHSPADHIESSKRDLPGYFDQLQFKAVGEIRLQGNIPAAQCLYSYSSSGGRVTEKSVTVFCKNISFQFICDMPESKQGKYLVIFNDILESLNITHPPVDINWTVPDKIKTYGAVDSFWEKVLNGTLNVHNTEKDADSSIKIAEPVPLPTGSGTLQTSSPTEAINRLFDVLLPSLGSSGSDTIELEYENYQQPWGSQRMYRVVKSGINKMRDHIYKNLVKTSREPGFQFFNISMFDNCRRLVSMTFSGGKGASVCIMRTEYIYCYWGNLFFE